MGSSSSKHEKSLQVINRDVQSIRSSIRSSSGRLKTQSKDVLAEKLIKQTNEVTNLKGKVNKKKVDDSLKLISITTNELLMHNVVDDRDLDKGSVETDSFIGIPVRKGQMQLRKPPPIEEKPSRLSAFQRNTATRRSVPTLNQIETKLKALKPMIVTAIKNQDKKQLRVHKQTIKVMATDLELIPVQKNTPLDERKNRIQTQLSSCFQRIDKAFREISRNSNIEYLVQTEKKDNAWKGLATIENEMGDVVKQMQKIAEGESTNIKIVRESLLSFNPLIDSVEDLDDHIKVKKLQLQERTEQLSRSLEETVKNRNSRVWADSTLGREKPVLEMKNVVVDEKIEMKVMEQNGTLDKGASVVLRKNLPTSSLDNLKTLDSFIERWHCLENDINVKDCSQDDLTKLDLLLEDLQKSVMEKRKSITTLIDDHQASSSLNVASGGSTKPLSADDEIKTKASCSTMSSVADEKTKASSSKPSTDGGTSRQVVVKDKQSNDYLNAVAEIRDIQAKIEFIKEKLPQYDDIEEVLEKIQNYIRNLEKYVDHSNGSIANSAKATIQEVGTIMVEIKRFSLNPISSRRFSIEESVYRITEIRKAVDNISIEISHLNETTHKKMYENIISGLSNYGQELEKVVVLPQYTSIQQTKDETLALIKIQLHAVQKELTDKEEREQRDIKQSRMEFEKLRRTVDRFSGMYKNVLYIDIEMKLHKLLGDIVNNVQNNEASEKLLMDIEKYLKILEERATKVQPFEHRSSSSEQLDKVDFLENAAGEPKIPFVEEQGLSTLSTTNSVDAATELGRIEQKMAKIQPECMSFEDLPNSEKYAELSSALIDYTLRLDQLSFTNEDDPLSKRRYALKENIHICGFTLNARAKDLNNLMQVDKQLALIGERFEGANDMCEMEQEDLDEELIALQIRLGRMDVTAGFMDKKRACSNKIATLLKKLKEIGTRDFDE